MKRLISDGLMVPEDVCRPALSIRVGREGGFAGFGNPGTLKAKLVHGAGYGGGIAGNPER